MFRRETSTTESSLETDRSPAAPPLGLGRFRGALSYLHWRMKGRPVGPEAPSYGQWMRVFDGIRPDEPGDTPITVIINCIDGSSARESVRSILRQSSPHWRLIVIGDDPRQPRDPRIRIVDPTNPEACWQAINSDETPFVCLLSPEEVLAPIALEWASTCLPRADLVYFDGDRRGPGRTRVGPVFKPAWSPHLLQSVDYLGPAVIRTSTLLDSGATTLGSRHAMLLHISRLPLLVAHLPLVLSHQTEGTTGPHLGTSFSGAMIRGNSPTLDPKPGVSQDPVPIKAVIPTRDRRDLLEVAVTTLTTLTDHPRLHLVIVDNGSKDPDTLDYLAGLANRPNVTVVRADEPFNFSRLCNLGAASGPDTPHLLFLNNDIEIIHPQWLNQLQGWLADTSIRAVGPKLLFPNRTIQEAGVVLGMGGGAGHYAAHLPDSDIGPGFHHWPREVTALTAACLVVRTDEFNQIGGFDEGLPIDLQDIDLCLRITSELGGWTVCDPTFPVAHHQSATRGDGMPDTETVALFRSRWGQEIDEGDPFYNPHLTLWGQDLSLAALPSVENAAIRCRPRWQVNRFRGLAALD